jgi:hypothetical protein
MMTIDGMAFVRNTSIVVNIIFRLLFLHPSHVPVWDSVAHCVALDGG